jgi:hypothetical protein
VHPFLKGCGRYAAAAALTLVFLFLPNNRDGHRIEHYLSEWFRRTFGD